MPTYQRDGTAEVAFAGQRQYVSVYIMRTDVRGCLRFRTVEKIDFGLVRDLLKATAHAPGQGQVC